MDNYSRRKFLYSSAGLLALAMTNSSFERQRFKPLLSFSTIGCPDWSFDKMVSFAKTNGYDGLEIRNIERQLDLPKSAPFSSAANIKNTVQVLRNNGLRIANLGASSAMHHADPALRKKNMDEAKQFIDLAAKVNCPYIRVFPNDFPKDQERSATIDRISTNLLELGEYANNTNVTVLLESHGQVVKSDDLEIIMKHSAHKHVGMIWDIVNMWAVTKEAPVTVYPKLKPYIRHTHIKDLNMVNNKESYVLLGQGESPIFEGIDALVKGGYKGFFSFEWEKLWHPEIQDPEIALADYPKVMAKHFSV